MNPARRRLLPAVPVLLGAALLLAAGAQPAAAHAGLVSTTPGERSSVETLPADVRLTFNETMNRPSYVTVKAPDGTLLAEGEATIDGADLVQQVDEDPGLAGTYRVDYRAISADGHPVEGAFEFDVTTGAEAPTGPVEKVTSSTAWWVTLVALPWLALGALLLLRRRRKVQA
ncbi:copper resistance CopC family protein [Aeromicrobium alkaliterrae]|uniref:CopC domain-containing protein n=1 Tax=Aeromicrobium alkaliterrae TaxID=302168 RepID=A0ABN2JJN4_9ACTN